MAAHIYAKGIYSISVCVPKDWTNEQIEAWANERHPTGISSGWHCSTEPTFSGGEPQPGPCDTEPTVSKHVLMHC